MTEEEAKTKWCPAARVLAEMVDKGTAETATAEASYNRRISKADSASPWIPTAAACIGSACMAWRVTDNEAGPSAPDGAPPTYKAAGYCGLAGKP